MVGEDDLLTLLDGLDQLGLVNAGVGQQLGGLGGQRAQAAGLVRIAVVIDLVQKLGPGTTALMMASLSGFWCPKTRTLLMDSLQMVGIGT